jgi:superfamily II DNA helicase RecQ
LESRPRAAFPVTSSSKRLGSVIEKLGHPTVLALTATANEDVRAQIITRLGMRDPKIVIHGFDRPHIWLGVETAASEAKKRAMLLERLRTRLGQALSTRAAGKMPRGLATYSPASEPSPLSTTVG